MADILGYRNGRIDLTSLRESRTLRNGMMRPAEEEMTDDTVQEHSAEPIKSMDDIDRICEFLLSEERYRDYMLFIVGINFGLRVSDLRTLRFANIINDNFTFKDTFPVFEQKTRNTRKRKVNRYITVNDAVVEAVTLYLEHQEEVPSLSDYMFRSESNNGKNVNKPLERKSIDRILKGIAKDLGLTMRVSTHTFRKTFCYHQMLMSNNDSRKLLLLQKMLNHSTPAQTLAYIGISGEEIEEAYRQLNLGSVRHNYMAGSNIIEFVQAV